MEATTLTLQEPSLQDTAYRLEKTLWCLEEEAEQGLLESTDEEEAGHLSRALQLVDATLELVTAPTWESALMAVENLKAIRGLLSRARKVDQRKENTCKIKTS